MSAPWLDAARAIVEKEAPRDWPTSAATAWDHERLALRRAIKADDMAEGRRATAGLKRIRANWPNGNGSGPDQTEPLLMSWAEYKRRAEAKPEGDFVVPKLYRRGQSSLLVGEPKVGKSTLCRSIAVEVARGGNALGYPLEAAVAVYMPLQEDERHVVREIEKQDPAPGVKLRLHNPGQPMDWDRLAVELTGIDASLLMVDMVSDFKIWEDGNNYVEMKGVIGQFTRLARDTNCHVLLVHHGNKTSTSTYPTARVHGSAAIGGEVDVVASVHRDPKKGRVYQAEGRGIGFFERPISGGPT